MVNVESQLYSVVGSNVNDFDEIILDYVVKVLSDPDFIEDIDSEGEVVYAFLGDMLVRLPLN